MRLLYETRILTIHISLLSNPL